MVRISLPNRLKSYGGTSSASHSRSSSPNPGMATKKLTGGSEASLDGGKGNGLVLKVVVLRVRLASQRWLREGED